MFIRDDRQVAVNLVEEQCFATADHYEHAAAHVEDARIASLFLRLAGERREIAAALATQIRRLDDLPQQPDPDRESVSTMLEDLKAYLSGNADATLVSERLADEQQLQVAIADALRHELTPEMVEVLRRLREHAETASKALAAMG